MRWLDRAVTRVEETIIFCGLLGGTVVAFVDVIARYVFGTTLGGGGELTNASIIWAAMVGAALGVRAGVHIGVDVLVKRFPAVLAKAIIVAGLVISALFTAFITYQGAVLVLFSLSTGQVTMELLAPRWLLYASVPVGMGLMTLHLLQEAWRRLTMPAERVRAELSVEAHPEATL